MSGISIALKFSSLIAGVGLFLILFKRIKSLKQFGLSGLLYILGLSFILSLSTLFLLFNTSSEKLIYLIGGQVFILLFGILHVIYSKSIIPWISEQSFVVQIFISLCILIFTRFFSGLWLSYVVHSSIPLVWYLSVFWFIVPMLLNQSINKLLEVPKKEYKHWLYPVDVRIEDPTDKEMENPVVISFVFRKTEESNDYTSFRAKAPVGMQLGRLFYFFINDYNSRHPESMVSYLDDTNNPDQWMFFKIKNKVLKSKVALDPEDSIYNNQIREDDILICKRLSN